MARVKSLLRLTSFRRNTHNKIKTISPSPGVIIGGDFTEGHFQRQFTIDLPVPPGARPAIGNRPNEAAIAEGTFAPGSPWAICISPGPNQVLYSADAFPGRIYRLTLEGELLGVLGESGKQLKQFGWIHEMACPQENVLYVAELLNWRVQKLILHA